MLRDGKIIFASFLFFIILGFTAKPPFAIRDVITASCNGVTKVYPCPIDAVIVSPVYHASLL